MCSCSQIPSYNRAHTYSLKQKFTHNGPLLPMNRFTYTLTLSHLCSRAKVLKQKNPNNKYTKKMLKTFTYQKCSLISSHQCDENLTHMPAHIQIVDLKPHEFPGWNLKLTPMYEGQGDTRARGRALQVDGWQFFFLALDGKFLYIYMCVCVCVYVCVYICVCVCVYIYMFLIGGF